MLRTSNQWTVASTLLLFAFLLLFIGITSSRGDDRDEDAGDQVPKVVFYQVAVAVAPSVGDSVTKLQALVNQRIEKGMRPIGGIDIQPTKGDHWLASQAMVRLRP